MSAPLTAEAFGPRPAALVTGSAKGIGKAILLALAADGHDVMVHYRRSQAEAEAVVEKATSLGAHAVAVAADVTVEAEAQAGAAHVEGQPVALPGGQRSRGGFREDVAVAVAEFSDGLLSRRRVVCADQPLIVRPGNGHPAAAFRS